ncbi:UDP-glycosyltransferase family, conserved site [Sesbania bispinosa]|nr:UDP-glycosyltransferase family, conserved site [Sesbania bispinosa]
MGHLIPTLELGKRLLTHHGFDVTIFVIATDSSTTTSQILQQTSNVNALNIVIAPPIDDDVSTKLGPHPSIPAQIGLTIHESLPFLRSSILSMKHPPSALIVDLFGTVAFPLAREFGMSTYVFFATNAWFSAITIYLPFLDKQMVESHAHNHEPLLIPGCDPVRFEDTLISLASPDGPMYEGHLKTAQEIVSVDGILMNTWQDLEPEATKALIEPGILGRFTKGPVYAVGPLVRTAEAKSDHGMDEAVLRWLDRQAAESVMYVSFGSGGTMSESQMRELALGLELSQQRFVWVVRPPKEGDACGAFFDVCKGHDGTTSDYLPEGFLRRTQEMGLVVPMWAPQSEILRHPATAGFMTHCGWNSVLESMVNGIPMIAWPLYAEQKMNAFILSEKIGVAVRVKEEEEEGIVCREHIAELVRRVMVNEEGIAMRTKVKEVKLSGEKALSKFGTSHKSLYQMAKDCEFHGQGSERKARGA